jgi:hypothetical protein
MDPPLVICLSDNDDDVASNDMNNDKSSSGSSQKENVINDDDDAPRDSSLIKNIDAAFATEEEMISTRRNDNNGNNNNNDEGNSSDVEVLDIDEIRSRQASTTRLLHAAAATTAPTADSTTIANHNSNDNDNGNDSNSDEELEIVGTTNEQRLPHNRQDCLEYRYTPTLPSNNSSSSSAAATTNNNAQFCQLCYCYVCDKPAVECTKWYMGQKGQCTSSSPRKSAEEEEDATNGRLKNDDGCADATTDNSNNDDTPDNKSNNNKTDDDDDDDGGKKKSSNNDNDDDDSYNKPYNNHCHATNRGINSLIYKNMRLAMKENRDISTCSSTRDESLPTFGGMNGGVGGGGHQQYGGGLPPGLQQYMANYHPYGMGGYTASITQARQRYRTSATARGGARQVRGPRNDEDSARVTNAANNNVAAAAATAAPVVRRTRSNKRPAPHDHQARLRTQQMLEDLYG